MRGDDRAEHAADPGGRIDRGRVTSAWPCRASTFAHSTVTGKVRKVEMRELAAAMLARSGS